MMDYIVVNLNVVCSKHTNGKAESIVECTAVDERGYCIQQYIPNVQEGQGVSRVIEVCPSFLAGPLELYVGKVTRTCRIQHCKGNSGSHTQCKIFKVKDA